MCPDVLVSSTGYAIRGSDAPALAGALACDEVHLLRRFPATAAEVAAVAEPDLATVCSDLAGSVGRDDLTEALSVIATAAGCTVALLPPDRSALVVGMPRTVDPARIVADAAGQAWRWTVGGRHVDRELTICSGTRLLGTLVFHRPLPGRGLTAPVWQTVHDLLALALLARDASRRAEAAELRAALLTVLSDDDARPPAAGAGDGARYRPAIVAPVGRVADLCGRLAHRISGEPLLAAASSSRVDDRIVVLYPEPAGARPRAHAEAWSRVADGLDPAGCRVAVGTAVARGTGLRDSYRTARWLADLQATPAPGLALDDVAVVDELGVIAGALGPGWGPRVGDFVRRVLGDLVDNPRFGGEVVGTLHAYLITGGSPAAAARLLHLSPSSMKYRMRIIRETLGDRLDDHDSAFEIELALRLLNGLQARGPGSR